MIADAVTIEELKSIPFLHDLAPEHIQNLASIARVEDYPARSTIFSEHDRAESVYLVVSGEVSIVAFEPGVGCRQLTTVGKGEILGWSPMLERGRFTATAQTQIPTRVVVWAGSALRALCRKDTELGYEFMRRVADLLADRLLSTRLHMLKLRGIELPKVRLESD
jgi:CRP-like cAMP-binding protein